MPLSVLTPPHAAQVDPAKAHGRLRYQPRQHLVQERARRAETRSPESARQCARAANGVSSPQRPAVLRAAISASNAAFARCTLDASGIALSSAPSTPLPGTPVLLLACQAQHNVINQRGFCSLVFWRGPWIAIFHTHVSTPEEPGAYFFSPFAACIAGAARLMLALLERCVTDAGGWYAMCDTDSMAIVATKDGRTHSLPRRRVPHAAQGGDQGAYLGRT